MFDSLELLVRFRPAARVAIFGHQPHFLHDSEHTAERLAVGLGAHPSRIALAVSASGPSCPGFKLPMPAQYGEQLNTDGLYDIPKPKSALGFQTADCGALFLYDQKTGKYGAYHCGRPALDPRLGCESGHCDTTIIENALDTLVGHTERSELQALVVGNICGPCFTHENEGAEKYVASFRKLPSRVFADEKRGALDLYAVIKHRLMHHGLREANIRQDGPCTLETPSLSSYRRDSYDQEKAQERNTILLVCD